MLNYINTDASGLPATIDENGNVIRRTQSNANYNFNFASAGSLPAYPNMVDAQHYQTEAPNLIYVHQGSADLQNRDPNMVHDYAAPDYASQPYQAPQPLSNAAINDRLVENQEERNNDPRFVKPKVSRLNSANPNSV